MAGARPEEYDEPPDSPTKGRSAVSSRLETIVFSGPSGRLEGLWKEAVPPRRGGAVFAHPHPLHGGTLHNKVVYRAARALVAEGFGTLRFNFRGVGLSEGVHDDGQGESDDVRAALDEAERRAGLPLVSGGFSFGSAAALRACAGDSRVVAFIGVGFPLLTPSVATIPPPAVPALFVTGEFDAFGPPGRLLEWARSSAEVQIVPGADHFLAGRLDVLESAIVAFLRTVAVAAAR
jgi:alpha/beta superfamily hydrolase